MPLNAACGVYYARHLTYIFGMFPVFMIFSKWLKSCVFICGFLVLTFLMYTVVR